MLGQFMLDFRLGTRFVVVEERRSLLGLVPYNLWSKYLTMLRRRFGSHLCLNCSELIVRRFLILESRILVRFDRSCMLGTSRSGAM